MAATAAVAAAGEEEKEGRTRRDESFISSPPPPPLLQDEEYVGALAAGCKQYYWTVTGNDWMYEWTNALIAAGPGNKIWSMSWGR